MGKYFGTDGVRGKANETLFVEMAYKIGRYLGYYYTQTHKGKMLIGKDTRISSSMFELAIASGATASGCHVYLLGTCPTPAVAYLVNNLDFDCGVMISASHNPYYDNGIKVFSHDGTKIKNEIEDLIESFIDGIIDIPYAMNQNIGQSHFFQEGLDQYLDHLIAACPLDLTGMRIACDCANGSSTTTAVQLLRKLNATVDVIHNTPDGININTNCGSTHPESLQTMITQGKYDIGLAFDGDADRLIAVDSSGALFDGDKIIYTCSRFLARQGKLKDNTVVTTVMANLGLYKALDRANINYVQTQVGDKYVYENMCQNEYSLGGEQSGHIIFKSHATTGDGLLTALKLLETMKATEQSLIELTEDLFIYPQLLKNTKVIDKNAILNNTEVLTLIHKIELDLQGNGRILVRPSGTEPLLRVMVEAKTDDLCKLYVNQVIDKIQELNL